jgi:membrane protein DedA with SNARE-associated domain
MDVSLPSLYEGIFLGTLSTCVVPLPEESTLLAAGYAARLGQVSFAGAVAAAWAAVMVGDALGYAIGRFFIGALVRTRVGARIFPERWRRWGEEFVTRHGERAVFFARFLVGLRGFVYFAVGAARLSFVRFLGVNAAAALLDVGVLVTVGFACGELRERHAGLGPTIDVGVAALLALTLLGPALTKKRISTQPAAPPTDRDHRDPSRG